MTTTDDLLAEALHEMAEDFGDSMFADMLGGKFTCAEAERVDNVLRLSGHYAAADTWLRAHAEHDSPGDLHGICRHCGALIYIYEPGEGDKVMGLDGSPWCSDDREVEHEPRRVEGTDQ